MPTTKLTILHSNDMHGDFLAEAAGAEGHLIGGLSLLSGYLNRVRREDENVLFLIAGDMIQGSTIDSEFRGLSTFEIMNYLAPDVVTLGNHELDYGLPHLLFLEKVASFPIVNANLYIRNYGRRLMQPYVIRHIAGLDVLFIGVITDMVLQQIKKDAQIASFITLEEAGAEVGRICNAYKDEDIDLTVLLTHIGFESDKELAALLDPAWGVDLIIGGHSHTVLEQPALVNGVLIAQAGVGTDQIGRFDIVVDEESNAIVDWTWQLIPVDENLAEPDADLEAFINTYKEEVDRKYASILCRLARTLTHPARTQETEIGNLFADILAERAAVDVMLLGSGSIRGQKLGPVVTLGDLKSIFPYDDTLFKCNISGAQLRQVFHHVMRPDNLTGEGECFQVSHGVRAEFDEGTARLVSLALNGEAIADDRDYSICMQGYHFQNSACNLSLSREELTARAPQRVVSTCDRDVVEEHFRTHQHLNARVEGRLIYRASSS